MNSGDSRNEDDPVDPPPRNDDEDFDDEPFGPDDIEASLNDALSDLERMLAHHGDGEAAADGAGPAPREPREEEPYTIPMLEEIVIPGPGISNIQRTVPVLPADGRPKLAAMDESASRQRLAVRLASEIEVIVQDRLEHAINKACEEIREQVRNHMDIILPEIVEEMLQHRRRDED